MIAKFFSNFLTSRLGTAPPLHFSLDNKRSVQNLSYIKTSGEAENAVQLAKNAPQRFVYPASSIGVVYDKKTDR